MCATASGSLGGKEFDIAERRMGVLRHLGVLEVANPNAVESMDLGAASFGLDPSSVSLL